MRGAPQVGFSATIRKISARNSLLTYLLARFRCREIHAQYNSNPARCHRTTVLWLNQGQRAPPTRPEPAQHYPEQSVKSSQPRLWAQASQDGQLLPKSQVFHEQLAAGAKRSDDQNEKKPRQAQHEKIFACQLARSICLIRWHISILARHRLL